MSIEGFLLIFLLKQSVSFSECIFGWTFQYELQFTMIRVPYAVS